MHDSSPLSPRPTRRPRLTVASMLEATWLLAAAFARQLALGMDVRLARRLSTRDTHRD